MWSQLQRAIVTVFEKSLSIEAEKFFGLLDGDPPTCFDHDAQKRVPW
jgi:hypothetical protein